MRHAGTTAAAVTGVVVAAVLQAGAYPLHVMDPGIRPTNMSVSEYLESFHRYGFAGMAFNVGSSSYIHYLGRELERHAMKLTAIRGTLVLRADGVEGNPAIEAMVSTLRGFDSILLLHVRSPAFRRSSSDGDDWAVPALRTLADKTAGSGIRIAIEHRMGDWIERWDDAVRIVRKVNRPNVGAAFNLLQWLAAGGGDPEAALRAADARLMAFVLAGAHGASGRSPREMIRPLDEGDYNWRPAARAAMAAGFSGPFILQLQGVGGDMPGHLQRSIDCWRTTLMAP